MPEWAFTSIIGDSLNIEAFLICMAASLILGLIVSCTYMYRNNYSSGFVATLALLPAMVQMVIMMVNGSIGTGIAVMGAFSLVRFRSVPGSAREISSIFMAMSIGLATGLGYIGAALLFTVIMSLVNVAMASVKFGAGRHAKKNLKITVPEGLDYNNIFDDLFAEYTSRHELTEVKTTNMGSLFKLTYQIIMKDNNKERELIDAIRCRNGNLEITCARVNAGYNEL